MEDQHPPLTLFHLETLLHLHQVLIQGPPMVLVPLLLPRTQALPLIYFQVMDQVAGKLRAHPLLTLVLVCRPLDPLPVLFHLTAHQATHFHLPNKYL